MSDYLIEETYDDCKHSHGHSEQPEAGCDLRDFFLLCVDHFIKEAVDLLQLLLFACVIFFRKGNLIVILMECVAQLIQVNP